MNGSRTRSTAAALLTLGGIAGGFGLASCCALPMLFFSLGLGTAWLGGIGLFAAFHEGAFLAVALVGLIGGAAMLVWQRERFTPIMLLATGAGLFIGAVLLWAGLTYV